MTLGINQQLDLHTLLIQSGRVLAEAEGWFPYVDSWKDYLELLGLGLIAEGGWRASKH